MVDEDDDAPLLPGLQSDGYSQCGADDRSEREESEAGGAQPFPPLPPPVGSPSILELPSFLRNDRETLEEPRVPADYVTKRCIESPLFARPSLPWESGSAAYIFGLRKTPPFLQPTQVGAQEFFLQASFRREQPARSAAAEEFSAVRAYYAYRIKSPDHARFQALQRFKVLLIAEPTASRLGEMVWDAASSLDGDAEIKDIISDSVAGKATATLVKYIAALWRYAKWIRENKLGAPLRPTETVIWRYLCFLRESRVGATAGSTVLLAFGFLYRTAQVKEPALDFLMSSRVRGVARVMYEGKEPLRQAPPLTTEMVRVLEAASIRRDGAYLTLAAGHFCFCIYACSRFGDSQELQGIQVSSNARIVLVETQTLSHKIATTKERKTTFLPLLALGAGLEDEPWAYGWEEARSRLPVDWPYALPAYSWTENRFLDRKPPTGEASLVLREILAEAGIDSDECWRVSSHSLKSTVLSWCSKSARVSFEDRRLLGHHMDRRTSSPLTYSGDEATRLAALVHGILDLIRRDILQPDLPRVHRLAALIEQGVTQDRTTVLEQDAPASDVSSNDCASEDFEGDPNEVVDVFPGIPPSVPSDEDLFVHTLSSVVHYRASETRLKCGRLLSGNYQALHEGAAVHMYQRCCQCAREDQ